MKITIAILLTFLYFTTVTAQEAEPIFNAALAKSLGADEYGMNYMFLHPKKEAYNCQYRRTSKII
jgi:hypothetical protein